MPSYRKLLEPYMITGLYVVISGSGETDVYDNWKVTKKPLVLVISLPCDTGEQCKYSWTSIITLNILSSYVLLFKSDF